MSNSDGQHSCLCEAGENSSPSAVGNVFWGASLRNKVSGDYKESFGFLIQYLGGELLRLYGEFLRHFGELLRLCGGLLRRNGEFLRRTLCNILIWNSLFAAESLRILKLFERGVASVFSNVFLFEKSLHILLVPKQMHPLNEVLGSKHCGAQQCKVPKSRSNA
jgi:hypothetical protein